MPIDIHFLYFLTLDFVEINDTLNEHSTLQNANKVLHINQNCDENLFDKFDKHYPKFL